MQSLVSQTSEEVTTVVVDQGSSDGTADWVREHWPDATLVCLPANVGVTAGFNVCLDAAAGADLIVLLNNDMVLQPDFIAHLVSTMEAHPRAAVAGGKLLNANDRSKLDGAGDTFSWRGTAFRRGHGDVDIGQFDREEQTFGTCAGAAMYRPSAIADIGVFDERFGAFLEDVDWSFRARRRGWECWYAPDAVALHIGSATIGQGLTDFTAYHLWRNGLWVVAKNYPASALVLHAPALLTTQALQLAEALHRRQFRVWRRAVRDALASLPAVVRQREGARTRPLSPRSSLDFVMEPAWSPLVRGWADRARGLFRRRSERFAK